ncbi:hypothetical protein [Geobacillus thermoleovorans]|uniref:hypothetical protein n=1 Tax=Geobacillus thermoleovorans TaxID=33941 RepID=UPI001CC2197C|nr:hypothetical protein [Geobacillus thermoleovorans]
MGRMENERKLQRKSKRGRRGELSREELLLISDDNAEIEYTFEELCCKLSLYFGTKEPFFCTFLQKALSPFLKECAKFFVNYFGRENPSVQRRGRRT